MEFLISVLTERLLIIVLIKGIAMSEDYNNLHLKDIDEIFNLKYRLEEMRDRLVELDYAQDAAQETQELLLLIERFELQAQAHIDNLREVWEVVEHWQFCDSDEKDLKKALGKYRQEKIDTGV